MFQDHLLVLLYDLFGFRPTSVGRDRQHCKYSIVLCHSLLNTFNDHEIEITINYNDTD